MALAGHIIQINLNNSAQSCGVGDTTNTAAIIRAGTTEYPSINLIKKDRGFVMATWGRIAVVSLYASPNAFALHPSGNS